VEEKGKEKGEEGEGKGGGEGVGGGEGEGGGEGGDLVPVWLLSMSVFW